MFVFTNHIPSKAALTPKSKRRCWFESILIVCRGNPACTLLPTCFHGGKSGSETGEQEKQDIHTHGHHIINIVSKESNVEGYAGIDHLEEEIQQQLSCISNS